MRAVFVLLAFAAFASAAVNINFAETFAGASMGGGGGGGGGGGDGGDVVTIMFEPYNDNSYADPLTGEIGGMWPEMASAICEAEDLDCEFVLGAWSNCMVTDETGKFIPGNLHLNGWFDACFAGVQLATRKTMFAYSHAHTALGPDYFQVRPGESAAVEAVVTNLDTCGAVEAADCLQNAKIGFVKGWYINQECVEGQLTEAGLGAGIPQDGNWPNAQVFDDVGTLCAALLDSTIDLMLAPVTCKDAQGDPTSEDFFVQGSRFEVQCKLGGEAVVAKKTNRGLLERMNRGLQAIRESGEFNQICQSYNGMNVQPCEFGGAN